MLYKLSNTNKQPFNLKCFYSQAVKVSNEKPGLGKLIGETKHYPPANKEWTNSTYAYNKKSLRLLSVKDNAAKKLIKSYFNLSIEKAIARSKRMRSLIRKSTAKKLFVSSPEIKQTNDKVIITVYTFDRERQFLLRKLYFTIIKWEKIKAKLTKREVIKEVLKKGKKRYIKVLKKEKIFNVKPFRKYDTWRTRQVLAIPNNVKQNKSHEIFIKRKRKQFFPSKIDYKHKPLLNRALKSRSIERLLKRRYLMFIRKRKRRISKKIPYFNAKLYNQINFSRFILNRKKEFFKAKYLMQYSYLTNVLSSIGIRVSYLEGNELINRRKLKRLEKEDFEIVKSSNLNQKDNTTKRFSILRKRKILNKKAKSIVIRKKVPYYIKRSLKHVMAINSKNINYIIIHSGQGSKKMIKLKNPSIYNLNLYLYCLVKSIFSLDDSKLTSENSNQLFPIYNYNNFSRKYFLDTFLKSSLYEKSGKDLHRSLLDRYLSKISNEKDKEKKEQYLEVYEKSLAEYKKRNLEPGSLDKINRDKFKNNIKKYNKNTLIINNMFKLILGRFKLGKFLTALKILINKIYNKKTELNIVNLKSPHLNTDIFTEAVAIKLKKRVGLLRVMRRSLQLMKLPYKFKSGNKLFNFNNLEILRVYRSLSLNNLNISLKQKTRNLASTDNLQAILKTLYYRTLANEPKNTREKLLVQTPESKKRDSMLSKVTSVLNSIKYKWVSGVRLEAAGRLTRRYTAARSAFKFRGKGSLKNIDYSRKLEFMNKSMPNVLLRNSVKSNSQYTFLKSKKRIGAFGLKTWISSY